MLSPAGVLHGSRLTSSTNIQTSDQLVPSTSMADKPAAVPTNNQILSTGSVMQVAKCTTSGKEVLSGKHLSFTSTLPPGTQSATPTLQCITISPVDSDQVPPNSIVRKADNTGTLQVSSMIAMAHQYPRSQPQTMLQRSISASPCSVSENSGQGGVLSSSCSSSQQSPSQSEHAAAALMEVSGQLRPQITQRLQVLEQQVLHVTGNSIPTDPAGQAVGHLHLGSPCLSVQSVTQPESSQVCVSPNASVSPNTVHGMSQTPVSLMEAHNYSPHMTPVSFTYSPQIVPISSYNFASSSSDQLSTVQIASLPDNVSPVSQYFVSVPIAGQPLTVTTPLSHVGEGCSGGKENQCTLLKQQLNQPPMTTYPVAFLPNLQHIQMIPSVEHTEMTCDMDQTDTIHMHNLSEVQSTADSSQQQIHAVSSENECIELIKAVPSGNSPDMPENGNIHVGTKAKGKRHNSQDSKLLALVGMAAIANKPVGVTLPVVRAKVKCPPTPPKSQVYLCPNCHSGFPRLPLLMKHMVSHSELESGQFQCPVCEHLFPRFYEVRKHMKDHLGEITHICAMCGLEFQTGLLLAAHTKEHVPRDHTLPNPFKCIVCAKTFATHKNLKRHFCTHAADKDFSCTECGNTFSNSCSLKVHMRSHTGELPYKCEQCGKRFRQWTSLSSHQRAHGTERPFKCKYCPKLYKHPSALLIHVRAHKNERPYVCEVCGRGFYKNRYLQDHLVVHTGERNFQCPTCMKTYPRKGYLRIHMKSHSDNAPFRCTHCPKSYLEHKGLIKHIDRVHSAINEHTSVPPENQQHQGQHQLLPDIAVGGGLLNVQAPDHTQTASLPQTQDTGHQRNVHDIQEQTRTLIEESQDVKMDAAHGTINLQAVQTPVTIRIIPASPQGHSANGQSCFSVLAPQHVLQSPNYGQQHVIVTVVSPSTNDQWSANGSSQWHVLSSPSPQQPPQAASHIVCSPTIAPYAPLSDQHIPVPVTAETSTCMSAPCYQTVQICNDNSGQHETPIIIDSSGQHEPPINNDISGQHPAGQQTGQMFSRSPDRQ